MDPNQISELVQLVKPLSLAGAGCTVLLGLFRMIRELCYPRALAKAVKSMSTEEEKDALLEMFRVAKPSPIIKRDKPGIRRNARRLRAD